MPPPLPWLFAYTMYFNETTKQYSDQNLFIKFCHKKAIEADQIFILGDLFDTWLGDDLSLDAYPSVGHIAMHTVISC
jgi:UDP-2,3-diacylglucosamine pyrophosphatase LpxH